MMILFCLLIFNKAVIPSNLKFLADQAIANSRNKKVAREERDNTAFPGDYSFPNVNFKLKRVVSAPTTNDIKGFAIDSFNVAIVKRKAFNLKEHFVFVDPEEQKFYDMNELIASDDRVNIYTAKELTIFDIMTNFDYRGKTEKAISPSINLNWDTANDGPVLNEIPNISGMKYGLGAYGVFIIDTFFRFSSFSDICLGADLNVIIKAAAEIQFDNGETENDEDITLFELPSIPLKGLGISFKFIGIEFSIQPFIKCKALISDIRITVPNNVGFLKGYNVFATKHIEITPYAIVDTKWDLRITNLPEKNTLQDTIENTKKAEISITPKLKFYLSIEMKFAGVESYFDVGLQIPFEFTFNFDQNKCLMPYLYGSIDINFQMFYEFGGITVTYHDASNGFKKKSRQLVKSSSNQKNIFKIYSGKFCLGVPSKAVEGSPDVLQQRYDRSYYIHNDNVYWSANAKNPAQIVIEAKSDIDSNNVLRMLPYQNWPTSSSNQHKPSTHLIVTSSEPPTINYLFNFYETIKKKEKVCFLFICKSYEYEQRELRKSEPFSLEVDDDHSLISKKYSYNIKYEKSMMNGEVTIYNCKDIDFYKVFKREKNSIVIANLLCDGSSYVLLNLDKNGDTKIDYNAEFYAETMLDESFTEKGIFHATKNHYYFKYNKFDIKEPMLVETNISLTTLQNGKKVRKTFGSVSSFFPEAKEYFSNEVGIDKQNFIFYSQKDDEPVLTFNVSLSVFKDNGQIAKKNFYIDFDYNGIEKLTFQAPRLLFPELESSFYFEVKYITNPRVTIKTSSTSDNDEVIAELFDIQFDKIAGKFQTKILGNATYFVLKITSKCQVPLKGNYIVLKNDKITPLVKNVVKVSGNVFCIFCDNEEMMIPVRKIRDEVYMGKFEPFDFEYLITDFNNPNEMSLNEDKEIVEFTSPNKLKAFIIPKARSIRDYFYLTFSLIMVYTLDIDDQTKIIALKNPNEKPETITITKQYLVFEEDQYMATFDATEIYRQLEEEDYARLLNIRVYCKSEYVDSIRCNNKIEKINSEGYAYFSYIPIPPNKTLEFYAFCTQANTKMCEIVSSPTNGSYQLIRFPTKDGINITGRGMNTAIINVSNKETFAYYKTYEEPIEFVRSYSNETNVRIEVTDIGLEDDFYEENDNETNSSLLLLDENITNNQYRQFCVKDDDDNIIPFSLKYFSENIDDFMKSIGAINEYDVTQYDINDDDCITVVFDALETNNINELSPNAVDLYISTEKIKIDTSKIKYIPVKRKRSKMSKGTIAGIVIGCILGVALIAAGIVVLIFFIKKKNNENSSTNENSKETVNISNENNAQTDEI